MPSLSFIDVGEPTAQRRRRNANQARSLVMTERRRRQRITNGQDEATRKQIRGKDVASLKRLALKRVGSARFLLEPWNVDLANDVSSAALRQVLNTEVLTNSAVLEKSFIALAGYDKPVTKHMHMLIHHAIKIMWPKYWPAKEVDGVSPLVKPWWNMFVRVPAVFHVFLYAAAVHYDDMIGQTSLSRTREILLHKDEALQQLRLAFKYGPTDPLQVCDQVLLAMTYLGFESEDNARDQSANDFSPFIAPKILASVQWKRHYAYARENVHTEAANNFILMKKGGLDCLTPPLAKSVAINDLQTAAKYIRRPAFPFWDIPDIVAGSRDPNVNVLPEDKNHTRPECGFKPLASLGLTSQALDVLERARLISCKVDYYEKDKLQAPEYHLLLFEKNRSHHELLSLPSATELNLKTTAADVYDCCRLGALTYFTGVMFPLPHSTGAPGRLINMIKDRVQNLGLEMCLSGGGKLLVWVVVLACVTAQNTIHRPWFVRRLKPVLAMEGIKTWAQLRNCCAAFLWMDSACNEAAHRLYHELSKPP